MKHIVLYSGGLGSYYTTKRLLERGIKKEDITLLFTDTKIEDEDLYRFLDESSKKLDIPLTNYSDGRDVWQVFKDRKFLSNSRVDHCSQYLKRTMSRKYVKQFKPNEVIIYLGYDWTEIHRFEKAQKAWLPYIISCPLTEKPFLDKEQMKIDIEEKDGIRLPRLYKMGFAHNNCGGGCVKAGIGHFKMLYEKFPERYFEWENNEEEIRKYINKDVSILRRTRNGVKKNITLKELRKEFDTFTEEENCDIGGCGCFEEKE